MHMLEIKDLAVSVDDKPILKGINLIIQPGEIHAIMGPNGSGKSTLCAILGGKPGYQITAGTILFEGKNLIEMEPEERAREGVFLAFQYPVEIPGVNNSYFIQNAVNAVRKHRNLEPFDAVDFLKLIKQKIKTVDMDPAFLRRSLNDGFSGGEKKRNEILQMMMLEPKLAILDETDSGLDIDALKLVSEGVHSTKTGKNSFLLITHYQRLLDYIVPDFVHVLLNGKIVKTSGKELALELESRGYDWIIKENPVASVGA